MDVLHNIIILFLLPVGVALIFWGEDFFRLLLSVSTKKFVNTIKKSFVFLISGFATALTGLIILWSLGIESETMCVISGLILFVGGGFLSVRFYKYAVITFCLLGSQAIFIVMYGPYFESHDYELGITLDRILRVCSEHIICYLFLISFFTLFGIYFHRKKAVRPNDNEQQLQDRLRFRKTAYLCAGLAVFSYFLRLISGGYTTIFEINIFSWPIIAVAAFWFIKWLVNKGYKYSFIHNDKWAKFIYLIAFGLIILPIITAIITFIMSMFFPQYIPRGHICSFVLYPRRLYTFACYPLPAFTARSAFSILVFSILTYHFVLKEQKIKFRKTVSAKMEVSMSYMLTGIIVGGAVGIVVGGIIGLFVGMAYGGFTDVAVAGLMIGAVVGAVGLAIVGGKVALLLQAKREVQDAGTNRKS
ncbi:MAG: hypothetical protein ABIH64_03915 [Nanoarchaeota archaeon]